MANPPKQRRSTESYGLGQSGYTAGRREGDPSLERDIEVRNRGYPRESDEHVNEQGVDERWTGHGGPPLGPETSTRSSTPPARVRH